MKKIEDFKKEYEDISKQLTLPDVISDTQKLQELSRRYSELGEIIQAMEKVSELDTEIRDSESMIKNEKDEELIEMAKSELENKNKEKELAEESLEELLSPTSSIKRAREAIVEIRSGVGGDEASLFAQDLFKMYSRYADLQGWKITILNETRTELKGLREITFEIVGDEVYKKLRNESGVHRVQRIPETEKSGRIHTSTASVAVLPKAKNIDIEIRTQDLKIETFRASGPGGQNVNKVSTAVRVTHLPSGEVVASQESRSQAKNKETALTILRSRLFQQKLEEEEKKIREERREQIGSGERSEKIRTYNFPQDRITDHRINKSWHGIQKIMYGDMEAIVEDLAKQL